MKIEKSELIGGLLIVALVVLWFGAIVWAVQSGYMTPEQAADAAGAFADGLQSGAGR